MIKKNLKTVYLGMSIDVLHHGHINIIAKAAEYGKLTIGLLTDAVIAKHKRAPMLLFNERQKIIENIKGVSEVITQNEWSYVPNIRKLKPDYFVHGDDWTEGPLSKMREQVIEELATYGGKLIEVPYTRGISSSAITEKIAAGGVSPEKRLSALKRGLYTNRLLRFIEAHSPISALIAENEKIIVEGTSREYDGFWSSSLTDSTEMGKPDIEALDITRRLNNIDNIFEVTNKPLIIDFDTGGKPEHFALAVKSMERLGISAVIIEDKTGLKKNSLFGNDVIQSQETVDEFVYKIKSAIANRRNDDFLIIARIESLILEKGMEDALMRGRAYVEAGADGIMIHSRQKTPSEIFEFAKRFRLEYPHTPLIAVPTSYNKVYEHELESVGFNIVIYANHLMRASYPAMRDVARSILQNGRTYEADKKIISVNEILELIPGTK